MSKAEEPCCERCRYFERERTAGEAIGTCHRFPPQIIPQFGFDGMWPIVLGMEWCGEFQSDTETVP